MTSAGLIQENGREFSFQPVRKRPMAATRAGTLRKTPRAMARRCRIENQSLHLIHPAASDRREMEVDARVV